MTKKNNETLPSQHDSEDDQAEARDNAVALIRQAVEQAALGGRPDLAGQLITLANKVEANAPRRKQQATVSQTQQDEAGADWKGRLGRL